MRYRCSKRPGSRRRFRLPPDWKHSMGTASPHSLRRAQTDTGTCSAQLSRTARGYEHCGSAHSSEVGTAFADAVAEFSFFLISCPWRWFLPASGGDRPGEAGRGRARQRERERNARVRVSCHLRHAWHTYACVRAWACVSDASLVCAAGSEGRGRWQAGLVLLVWFCTCLRGVPHQQLDAAWTSAAAARGAARRIDFERQTTSWTSAGSFDLLLALRD